MTATTEIAESLIGLYKSEVIHHAGPWRGQDDVEYAALEWIQWYNDKRLHGELGYRSPTQFEEQYPIDQNDSARAA